MSATAASARVLLLPAYATNPYLRLLAEGLGARGWSVQFADKRDVLRRERLRHPPAIVHLHWERPWTVDPRWWRAAFQPLLLIAFLLIMRVRGSSIVWTVHNLEDHDRLHPRTERFFQVVIARTVHGIIVHHPGAQELVKRSFRVRRRMPFFVMPLPSYVDVYGPPVASSLARANLGFDHSSRIIVAFGAIRKYKRLPLLISAFRSLPETDIRLVIAGRALRDCDESEVRQAADGDGRIHLWLRHIGDDEVAPLLSACDVFVLPSAEQLTSASLVAAMEFGLAVVASNQPQVRHLCGTEGAVLFDPEAADSLEWALRRVLESDVREMGRRNRERVGRSTETEPVDALIDAYRRVIDGAGRPRAHRHCARR